MYINDGKLNFQNILLSEYIDKSSLISYTNKSLYSPTTKFLCVSRPRRAATLQNKDGWEIVNIESEFFYFLSHIF